MSLSPQKDPNRFFAFLAALPPAIRGAVEWTIIVFAVMAVVAVIKLFR